MIKKLFLISLFCALPFQAFADTLLERIEGYKKAGTLNQNFTSILFDKEFNEELLPDLIASGLDGNFDAGEGTSNFHFAARKLSAAGLEAFLKSKTAIEVNRSNQHGLTILADAIGWGENAFERAKVLVEKFHADPNFRGVVSVSHRCFLAPYEPCQPVLANTAMHAAPDVATLNFLIEKGGDINAEGETRSNIVMIPTFSAVYLGRLDVLKRLVELKAKTENSQGRKLNTIKCNREESVAKAMYEFVDSL